MKTSATVSDVTYGTGYQIYDSDVLPAIESAEREVILITCFWASSTTRQALEESLAKLSRKGQQQGRRIRVRIGFSSTSVLQKLTQRGPRIYRPKEWHTKLGLSEDAVTRLAGLDLEITSIFYLPFSVWHPKFVIVDREVVFLPSCNVSWEEWFEVCVGFRGPLVRHFTEFWQQHWNQSLSSDHATDTIDDSARDAAIDHNLVECHFLPSPHSRNPDFRFPWQAPAAPPQTPLNDYLLSLWSNASEAIYIQTPNLTSPPVLAALQDVLKRGVSLRIVTSERLMILEQLVTAGTTTSRCVDRFIKDYRSLLARRPDVEMGFLTPGRLEISYYHPRNDMVGEPVQSHAKITIVDGDVVVFGSGNMDRASWYTSQELGVAVRSRALATRVRTKLQDELKGRTHVVFSSVATTSQC